MSFSKHHVFVYGTLKRGEPNEHWLASESNGYSNFLSKAKSVEKYPLIIASKYNIPFLIDLPGTGEIVHGEIYQVDDSMLSNLDKLEDYPHFYMREIREFCTGDGLKVNAWVYLLQKYRPDLLQNHFFSVYESRGPHGKVYCERFDRDNSYDARADVQGQVKD